MSEPLPPKARALLDAARGADDPSAEDRARIDAAMQHTLSAHGITLLREPPTEPGADAGSSALAGAKGALHAKLVAGLLAGALGATGLFWAFEGLPPQPPPPTSKSASELPATQESDAKAAGDGASENARTRPRASDVPPLPAHAQGPHSRDVQEAPERAAHANQETRNHDNAPPHAARTDAPKGAGVRRALPTRTDAPPKRRGPTRRRLRAASRRPAPSAAAESKETHLRAEMELLAAARHALGEGNPQRALRTLQRHARRFPNGALQQERTGLRVLALCGAGRVTEGRTLRDELLRKAPDALMGARVQYACEVPEPEVQP